MSSTNQSANQSYILWLLVVTRQKKNQVVDYIKTDNQIILLWGDYFRLYSEMNSVEIYPCYEDMYSRKKRKHRSNGGLRRNQPESLVLKMEDVATSQNVMVASGIWN